MSEVKKTVSHSEVETYLKCKRSHYYSYSLNLTPKQKSDAIARGSHGHEALERYFLVLQEGGTNEDGKLEATKYLVQAMIENPSEARIISGAKESMEWFFKANPFEGYKVLETERDHVVKFTDELHLPFIADVYLEDPFGQRLLVDTKFSYNFYTEDEIALLPQLVKYLGLMRNTGRKVDYVAYSIIRTRNMKENSVDNRYQLRKFYPTDTRIRRTMYEHIKTAKDIQAVKALPIEDQNDLAVRTSNGMLCKNCFFKDLCAAELSDKDVDIVLRSGYEKKKPREFDLGEGE